MITLRGIRLDGKTYYRRVSFAWWRSGESGIESGTSGPVPSRIVDRLTRTNYSFFYPKLLHKFENNDNWLICVNLDKVVRIISTGIQVRFMYKWLQMINIQDLAIWTRHIPPLQSVLHNVKPPKRRWLCPHEHLLPKRIVKLIIRQETRNRLLIRLQRNAATTTTTHARH